MGKWAGVTPYMFFCCAVFSFGNILYGLDVSSFGAIQTLPSWLNEFGEEINGQHVLGTKRKLIMNSAVWPGRLMGTLLFEPMVVRLGMKKTALLCAVIQCIALIIELAAPNWQAYAAGRSIAYFAVGIVENVVPIGVTWAAGVTKAYATETDRRGWIIPTAQQLVPGVVLMILVPFCVESPRWLLLRGRKGEALANLNRLRSRKEVESGVTEMEIAALDAANQESRANDSRWIELFQETYLRRSIIIALTFFFNEVTGQQSVNAYGPTLSYNILVTLCGLIACLIATFSNDRLGRVPLVLLSVLLTTLSNALVAGLGDMKGPTTTQRNVVIASIILINFSAKLGGSSQCYTIGAEIGGTRMRKKMMGFGTAIDVCSAFLVTFFTSYLQNGPHIQLRAKTAFIWMGASIIAFVFFLFQLPELNGRSLEEVDELFEQRLWAWQFRGAVTTGVGAEISQLEAGSVWRNRVRSVARFDKDEAQELNRGPWFVNVGAGLQVGAESVR